ncbi:MAG: nitroreductase family protein [Candidatus Omnitrophica bacterium]|nr:nitroreductase family protein [Candidatus Omnitrophota bacterium]
MTVLKLVKERKTIRKYQKKRIPGKILTKIIDAGIWGPSVVAFQPWFFIIITNKNIIRKINQFILHKVKQMGVVGNVILKRTAEAIGEAPAVIVIYNTGEFTAFAQRFEKKYIKITHMAEISAISAAIQNMILVAEDMGISTCWHDTPVMCEKEISKALNINLEMVAILSLGYSAERGKRAIRKKPSLMLKYIK